MKKILVVDDTESDRLLFSRILYGLGFVPVLASDGLKGLNILLDNPDMACLITDYKMPVMNGIELVRTLRADKRYAALPVIIHSAYIGVREVAGLLEHGATAFLPHPVEKKVLREYLERYLG